MDEKKNAGLLRPMFRDFVLILTMLASLINLSMFVNPQVAAWIRDALYR